MSKTPELLEFEAVITKKLSADIPKDASKVKLRSISLAFLEKIVKLQEKHLAKNRTIEVQGNGK